MSNEIRAGGFNILPTVVKNLLIINGLFFLAKIVLASKFDLDAIFGLHYFAASDFHVWQIITYMFMHGDFGHLFFNMFALWMFGASVENAWGERRFLCYYLITGIGAAMIHYLIIYFQIHSSLALIDAFLAAPSVDTFSQLANVDRINQAAIAQNLLYLQAHPSAVMEFVPQMEEFRETFLNSFNIIGASGSVFGLLLAFGMMYPNAEIYVYFLLPIKAKWFVVIYGALELLYGVLGSADGVAHFAHLGGMLFGFLLIMAWRHYDGNNGTGGHWFYPEGSKRKRRKIKFATSYDDDDEEDVRTMSDEDYNARKFQEQQRIDEILDKISKSGYDSLTREEKDILFKASKR
ncbi:MAG: rhomboid family intramembrane serine protease [Bacteroidales bacterium]|nr:rhomboid family intramembrane serine protease [Bacteroidales bacterium]